MTTSTIAAVATPPGAGGIAVIRVSGPQAIQIVSQAWKGKHLDNVPANTVTLGSYVGLDGETLDQALVTLFRSPHSFTGDDTVEISLHGSRWIQSNVLTDLIKRGASMAAPGEFTQRAFLNHKIDLAQAEGIADLIAASSKAAHRLAVSQTKGTFSKRLNSLRSQLIDFASLLELELDFSEEDVQFADRERLLGLALDILTETDRLARSFKKGAAIKDGFNIVIAGVPNAGKSSLLNLLLNEEKAIVSDIAGTTRDLIEDTAEINGILFRFTDTAGLRQSDNTIENLGIERARNRISSAHGVIWVFDTSFPLETQLAQLEDITKTIPPDVPLISLANKSDLHSANHLQLPPGTIPFSVRTSHGLETLLEKLTAIARNASDTDSDVIVTNARHYEALLHASQSMERAIEGIRAGISADFIAQDIREVLHHIGSITGAITAPTLLHTIFSRFCIGK